MSVTSSLPLVSTTLTLSPDKAVTSVAWRKCRGPGRAIEVLIFTPVGVFPLLGDLTSSGPVSVGQALDIHLSQSGPHTPNPGQPPWQEAVCAVSDGSSVIYFATPSSIWSLDESNVLHFVAGVSGEGQKDGDGTTASFQSIMAIALGRGGRLYVVDGNDLRVVQLQPAGTVAQTVSTITLDLQTDEGEELRPTALSYDRISGALYISCSVEYAAYVYKAAEPIPSAGFLRTYLVEPLEGGDGQNRQRHNVPAFSYVDSMAASDTGDVVVLDTPSTFDPHGIPDSIWVLKADGRIETPAPPHRTCTAVTLLPQGCLVLYKGPQLNTLELRPCSLKPFCSSTSSRAVPAAYVNKQRLGADYGALLGSNPPYPPDVTVVAGGSEFPAHRLVLACRSEYFARLFADGNQDSGEPSVALKDADAGAFEQLLGYMYTGELECTQQLLRPLIELADRLLLLDLSKQMQQLMLAGSSSTSVVADMLWAAEKGLDGILAALKEHYLSIADQVSEQAPDSLEQLVALQPKLHLELHARLAKRARMQ